MARKIFELHGLLSILGIEDAEKQLKSIDKEAKKVAKSIKDVGETFNKVGKSFTTMFTAPLVAASAAIGAAVVKTADYADELLDLTEITGLSSDTLQELEHVANVVGIDFQKLTQATTAFTGKLPKLLKDGSTAANVIKSLGINIKDSNGQLRSMDDLFPDIIKSLQGVENVTLRNSMAQQILGKDLDALAPLLGITADEFESLRKEAHETGVVMSGESLNSAADLKAEINTLKKQFEMLVMNLAVDFIPILRDDIFPIVKEQVIPALKDFGGKLKDLFTWFKNLNPHTKELVIKLIGLLAVVGPLAMAIGSVTTAISAMIPVLVTLGTTLLANPIFLLAGALGAVTLGVIAVTNATKDWQKTLEKDIATKRINEQKAALEELIELYSEQIDLAKQAGNEDQYGKVTGRIKELEYNLGSYGYDSYGSPEDKTTRAYAELDRIAPLPDQPGDPEEYKITTGGLDGDKEDPAIKMYERRRKYLDEQIRMEEDYADKSFNVNATEQQKLDRLYTRALVEAEEKGASSVDIDAWYAKESEKIKTEATKKEIESIQSLEDERLAAKTKSLSKLADIHKAELEQLEVKQAQELDLYKEGSVEYILVKEKQGFELTTLTAKQKEEEVQLEKDSNDKKINSWSGYIARITEYVSQFFSIISDYFSNQELEIDNRYTYEKERIEDLNATEEERKRLIDELDADTDKKKRALKRKQALLDKTTAIFNIGLSTAQGIMQAWATMAPPMAIAMSVIIGLLGAAQTAVVASKPIPAAKGAMVQSDPGRGAIMQVGEGYQDEVVLPIQSGVKAIVNEMIRELSGMSSGSTIITNNNTQSLRPIYLQIGTLVADDNGLKELENRMSRMRVLEAQRMGAMA